MMLFKLLGAPLSVPIAGIEFVMQQLATLAEQEMNNPDRIREELLLLQLQLDEGEITEEEYKVKEAEIMPRLRAVRDRMYNRNNAPDQRPSDTP